MDYFLYRGAPQKEEKFKKRQHYYYYAPPYQCTVQEATWFGIYIISS